MEADGRRGLYEYRRYTKPGGEKVCLSPILLVLPKCTVIISRHDSDPRTGALQAAAATCPSLSGAKTA
jgi:hypothetical protein